MTQPARPNRSPTCPYCKVDLDEGFVIDRGHGNAEEAQKWAKGPVVKHWLRGLRDDKEARRTVRSYRCPQCGLLQDYAL